jgi:hypothetical protein
MLDRCGSLECVRRREQGRHCFRLRTSGREVRECESARVRECESARVRECESARVRECGSGQGEVEGSGGPRDGAAEAAAGTATSPVSARCARGTRLQLLELRWGARTRRAAGAVGAGRHHVFVAANSFAGAGCRPLLHRRFSTADDGFPVHGRDRAGGGRFHERVSRSFGRRHGSGRRRARAAPPSGSQPGSCDKAPARIARAGAFDVLPSAAYRSREDSTRRV